MQESFLLKTIKTSFPELRWFLNALKRDFGRAEARRLQAVLSLGGLIIPTKKAATSNAFTSAVCPWEGWGLLKPVTVIRSYSRRPFPFAAAAMQFITISGLPEPPFGFFMARTTKSWRQAIRKKWRLN